MELFDAADLSVRRGSDVDYKATVDDPRIAEVRILRPQEIPRYVAQGMFDLGITGRDWIEETSIWYATIYECENEFFIVLIHQQAVVEASRRRWGILKRQGDHIPASAFAFPFTRQQLQWS